MSIPRATINRAFRRALARAAAVRKSGILTGSRAGARKLSNGKLGNKGSMSVMLAITIPAMILLGGMVADLTYYHYRDLLLRQTVQAAGLAAGDQLSSYYSTGSNATLVAAAQNFAGLNMPSSKYGTVVPTSGVVLGTWSGTAFTSGGSSPNAVQVTGALSSANNNAIQFIFGNLFNRTSVNDTVTVVTSAQTSQPFNTIVINDLSDSFQSEIGNQSAIDQAILNCVKGTSGSATQFGITFINGHAHTYKALTQASTNYVTLTAAISLITVCTVLEDPNCSTGSNVASGLYSAIQQFRTAGLTGKQNIVVITDGVPDAKAGVTYSTADGVTCTTDCSDTDLQTGAQTQAAAAKAAGISISTVYYSGDTDRSDQATYETFLASLVTGSGTSLVAPTAASINSSSTGICATVPSAVKTVM